jgi:hypothetical protein
MLVCFALCLVYCFVDAKILHGLVLVREDIRMRPYEHTEWLESLLLRLLVASWGHGFRLRKDELTCDWGLLGFHQAEVVKKGALSCFGVVKI